MNYLVYFIYSSAIKILDQVIWSIDFSYRVHKIFLAPSFGNFRVGLGKLRAVMLYNYARKNVPAYKDYLSKQKFAGPKVSWSKANLNDVPEMDKTSYIKQYRLEQKLLGGVLPKTGVMLDESSGSSGKPTSWARGAKERRMTRRIMQVAFQRYLGNKNAIVINTFSMGAWATGFNTSTCLLEIGRVKSIGPDIVKVVDSLLELGPDYEYVILGYPPFLRLLTEQEIDWKKYKISVIYGGEGLSESMREYLKTYYVDVVGSYGASDLEINIAYESPFTTALRKAIDKDEKLKQLLVKVDKGVLPMIFQYNPYDYLFETNEKNELLVTICRKYNISPRVRYNIHDTGHTIDFYKLKKLLKDNGYSHLLKFAEFDFGLLFHYGRSDLSVDYNGAVVGPEEVRQIIEASDFYTPIVNTFRLISYEDKEARKHLVFAIELVEDQQLNKQGTDKLLELIIESLTETNLDFKSASRTAHIKPEIKIYKSGTGIFDKTHVKLKNDYIWNIDYARAKEEGVI